MSGIIGTTRLTKKSGVPSTGTGAGPVTKSPDLLSMSMSHFSFETHGAQYTPPFATNAMRVNDNAAAYDNSLPMPSGMGPQESSADILESYLDDSAIDCFLQEISNELA